MMRCRNSGLTVSLPLSLHLMDCRVKPGNDNGETCAPYIAFGATGAFCPERLSASATMPFAFISSMKART